MGIQERKLQEKELRRKSILKAGAKLFKKIGYSDTSMALVADEAQLSKGTLYLYFKNKDDLYANCILENSLIYLNKFFEDAEEKSKTVEEAIISYADAYFRFTQEYPELFNMLLGIGTAASFKMENVSDETRTKIVELQKDMFTNRISYLQKGIDDGLLKDNFSTCYTIVQLWVSIVGALHLSKKNNLDFMFENIQQQEFLRDIAKIFVIAYTKNDELKEVLHKEIWENAVKQAPASIGIHSKIK